MAVVQSPDAARRRTYLAIPSSGIQLGREDQDPGVWAFSDPSLSRRHLRLEPREDGALVYDLGSSNGTWVAARRCRTEPCLLSVAGVLRGGETVLVLSDQAPPRAEESGPARELWGRHPGFSASIRAFRAQRAAGEAQALDEPALDPRPMDSVDLVAAGMGALTAEDTLFSAEAAEHLCRLQLEGGAAQIRALGAQLGKDLRPMERVDLSHIRRAMSALGLPARFLDRAVSSRRSAPEADRLRDLLRRHSGSIRASAAELQVERRQLYRWLHAAQIDPATFREVEG